MDERRSPRGEGPDKIGEILLKADLIDRETLREALAIQSHSGGRLGHILIDRGFVDQEDFAQALAVQLSLPYLSLEAYAFDPKVAIMLPRGTLEHHRVIPLKAQRERLTLAMADPFNEMAKAELVKRSGLEVRTVLATSSDILEAVRRVYGQIEARSALYETLWKQQEALRSQEEAEAHPEGVRLFRAV